MSKNLRSRISRTLGKSIRERRDRVKKTQVELAKDLNVSRSTISMWENGSVDVPSSYLPGLFAHLNISPTALLEPIAKMAVDKAT